MRDLSSTPLQKPDKNHLGQKTGKTFQKETGTKLKKHCSPGQDLAAGGAWTREPPCEVVGFVVFCESQTNGGFHSHGGTPKWLLYFMDNPNL